MFFFFKKEVANLSNFELVIIGNKIDLVKEKNLPRAVQSSDGELFAKVSFFYIIYNIILKIYLKLGKQCKIL